MELKNEEYELKSIISTSKFHVPEYQRYYSWEKNQLEDLWKDLNNLLIDGKETDHSHYMGTIICKNLDKDEELDHYDLVDGQQRLATLYIFLKCLEKKLGDKSISKLIFDGKKKEPRLQLQERELDDEKIFHQIMNGKENIETHAPSHERLVNARDYFMKKLDELEEEKSKKEVESLVDKVKQLRFMVYTIETKEKATLIFESINDRGKGLTNLEKVKSFLMHRTYLITSKKSKREERIEELRSNFAELYTHIEEIRSKELIDELDEDKIYGYHFASYVPKETVDNYDSEFDRKQAKNQALEMVKRHFSKEVREDEWEKIEEYSEDLAEFFESYSRLIEGNLPENIDTRNKILNGDARYYLPLLVRAEEQEYYNDSYQKFIKTLDAAAFRNHYNNVRNNRNQKNIFKLSHEVYTGEKTVRDATVTIKKLARLVG